MVAEMPAEVTARVPGQESARGARIAVFVSFSGHGGVERMMTNLLRGLVARGVTVDLLLVKAAGAHLEALPAGVNVIPLGSAHNLTCIIPLARYLRRTRPAVLLAAKDRAGKAALLARRLARTSTRLVIRIGTTVSAALEGRSRLKRWSWFMSMRRFYPRADAIVAVSQGVADDITGITGLAAPKLQVIPNPVVTPELDVRAAEPVDHPWFAKRDDSPIIIGAGRFTRQKDFPTLLRAFARVRTGRACRLMLLGDGREREACRELARTLGVENDVALPGFVSNPSAYMAKAQLFVLSSRWEGSPNVLTEALALGVPVAATDCPSGPREILRDGEYGPLVAVGDSDALAAAMERVLDNPPPAAVLREAVAEFTLANSTDRYLRVLLPDPRAAHALES